MVGKGESPHSSTPPAFCKRSLLSGDHFVQTIRRRPAACHCCARARARARSPPAAAPPSGRARRRGSIVQRPGAYASHVATARAPTVLRALFPHARAAAEMEGRFMGRAPGSTRVIVADDDRGRRSMDSGRSVLTMMIIKWGKRRTKTWQRRHTCMKNRLSDTNHFW